MDNVTISGTEIIPSDQAEEVINTPIETTDEVDEVDEAEVLKKVLKFRQDGIIGNQDWQERAEIAQDFYDCKQWDAADLAQLRLEKRPALTLNYIKPKVNFICGNERQNRKAVRVRPIKNASETVSKILTSLIQHCFDRSNGNYEKSEAFKNGIITGKGWLEFYIDYSEDPINGNIVIESVSPFDIIEDPLCKEYDLNKSARFIIREKWVNREELEAKYPDRADELGSYQMSADDVAQSIFGYGIDRLNDATDNSDININEYRVRTSECYWFSYKKRTHWFDREEFTDRILVSQEDIEKAKLVTAQAPQRFAIIERVDKILNRTLFCGNIILEHSEDPFKSKNNPYAAGISLFPIVRYAPYFNSKGYIQGVIDDLICPQQELNKRRSQALHLLNSTANGGWIVPKGSVSQETIDDLRNGGSNPKIIEVNDGTTSPTRIAPNQISQGHILESEQAINDMDKISGINPANQGIFNSGESGKLNELRQRQGMTINETLFDNFDYTVQIFANALVELIRTSDVYSKEEIEAIVEDADLIDSALIAEAQKMVEPLPSFEEILSKMPTLQNPQTMDADDKQLLKDTLANYQKLQADYQNKLQEIAKKLVLDDITNITKGRYQIKITDSPNSPTVRQNNLSEILQLVQMYPNQVPFDMVVEYTDLASKEELISRFKEQQAMQAQLAQQQALQQQRLN